MGSAGELLPNPAAFPSTPVPPSHHSWEPTDAQLGTVVFRSNAVQRPAAAASGDTSRYLLPAVFQEWTGTGTTDPAVALRSPRVPPGSLRPPALAAPNLEGCLKTKPVIS